MWDRRCLSRRWIWTPQLGSAVGFEKVGSSTCVGACGLIATWAAFGMGHRNVPPPEWFRRRMVHRMVSPGGCVAGRPNGSASEWSAGWLRRMIPRCDSAAGRVQLLAWFAEWLRCWKGSASEWFLRMILPQEGAAVKWFCWNGPASGMSHRMGSALAGSSPVCQ